MNLRILHVTVDFPYPPVHGGRADIWGRVCALSSLGHQIHLVCTVKERPETADIREVLSRVNRLDIVPRQRTLRAALATHSFQVCSRLPLAACALEPEYDLALMETELVAPILANPALKFSRLAVRVHNDESSFSKGVARSLKLPLLRAFHWAESVRVPATSREVFQRADQLWFSCRDLYNGWSASHPDGAGKASWLPVPVEVGSLRRVPLTGRRVIFIGNLVAATNIEGIEWYLANVHDHLRDIPGYHFSVVGSLLGGTLPRTLASRSTDPQMSVVTDAPDLGLYYQESSVFVNPMRHGASVKVKTIHAAANGLPVITTSVGNEGTGFEDGRHVLIRNSAEEFSRTLRELVLSETHRREELVGSAQRFLAAHYDHPARLRQLLNSPIVSGALPCEQ